MNVWLIAAIASGAALLPCGFMSLRGPADQRLVGLEMTSLVVILVMAMLAVGFGRPSFIDLPLTLAVLSFGGGLIFVRFLEKHL